MDKKFLYMLAGAVGTVAAATVYSVLRKKGNVKIVKTPVLPEKINSEENIVEVEAVVNDEVIDYESAIDDITISATDDNKPKATFKIDFDKDVKVIPYDEGIAF